MNKPTLPAWPQTGARTLLDHKRLSVAEHDYLLPDGRTVRWLVFPKQGDHVVVIARNAAGEVLVAFQYCPLPARTVDELPGGAIDAGETPEQAAIRELAEETGWRAAHAVKLGSYLVNNRRSRGRGHVVLCTGLSAGPAAPETGEIIASQWMTPAAINAAIRSGEIENVTFLAAWAMLCAGG